MAEYQQETTRCRIAVATDHVIWDMYIGPTSSSVMSPNRTVVQGAKTNVLFDASRRVRFLGNVVLFLSDNLSIFLTMAPGYRENEALLTTKA
jgi:hypothetical protein